MSATTTLSAPTRDQIVQGAQSMQQLIETAKTADPELYAKLTKATSSGTATPVGAALVMLITWEAGQRGLALPPEVVAIAATVLAGAVYWGLRKIGGIPGLTA
jgi:hypothetical protein